MARKLRIEYEGAIYHVMNRGDRREPIFLDDQDREAFLEALSQTCAKTGWQVHALCLMGNHFHLVVETPQANLAAGMKWFLGTYTARFNRRHQLFGHLFSGRYKALVVDGSGAGHLKTVCDYAHLNPVRAKLLAAAEPLRQYRWSSYGWYLQTPGKRPPWLRIQRLLGEHGLRQDSAASRREFERRMERRRAGEAGTDYKAVRRGWCLGDKVFRKALLEMVAEATGEAHYGEELRESAVAKAERIVAGELKRMRWTEQDLRSKRKGDAKKLRIAERVRKETTVTLAWIAERLQMGTKTYLAHLFYWRKRKQK